MICVFLILLFIFITYVAVTVKGIIAIERALFIALVIDLWCLAQLPEILLGIIFPRSVTKCRSVE
jgi:hypothetical protein